jgi:hypothetical protein
MSPGAGPRQNRRTTGEDRNVTFEGLKEMGKEQHQRTTAGEDHNVNRRMVEGVKFASTGGPHR